MFSWECTIFLKQKKKSTEMFRKIGVLKNFAIFTRKHLCWSLFGVFGVNFIKKILQYSVRKKSTREGPGVGLG